MKFAKNLRAVVIAILAILIINTTTITILDKYVFNKEQEPEVTPDVEIAEEDDDGLTEELMALFMTSEEPEEAEEENLESFDEHTDDEKVSAVTMFSVPSMLTPTKVDEEKKVDVSKQADAIYNKYYAILSGMQGSYEGRAAAILNQGKNEYYAAVKAGEKAKDARSRLYSKYFSILSGLLGECNGAVEGVLAQMTAELNAIGASTAGVGKLRSIYNSAVASYTGQF